MIQGVTINVKKMRATMNKKCYSFKIRRIQALSFLTSHNPRNVMRRTLMTLIQLNNSMTHTVIVNTFRQTNVRG